MPGAIDTSYTFTATDVITSTKMNNILDQSIMTATAVIGSTLSVTTGKLFVTAGGITSNELAANAVTTTAILDANVTTAKIADSNVTTAKIADSNVTTAKILDANVTTAKILDANVTTAKILDANVTAPKLSGAQTGTAPIFGVRAWVVFDMTKNAAGSTNSDNTTRYIPTGGSGNVTSVTKTASGSFTVAFTTALPSVNYSYVGSGEDNDSAGEVLIARPNAGTKTTSSIALKSKNLGGASENFPEVSLIFIG